MVSRTPGFFFDAMRPLRRREFLGTAVAAGLSPTLVAGAGSKDALGDWDSADATTLASWVATGEVSPAELLQEAVRRLRRVNPKLNLLAQDHIELALATVESPLPQGPLSGVPFLLKDLGVQLAGTVTSAGSALNAKAVAAVDSTLVQRLKSSGLVIFGKTNTPEFGLALTTEGRFLGDCRNPWHVDHSTGGSSGGSAAAVAAGVIPMAHATDGGGSIRVPATFCGLFGFKPTRGLTPGARGSGMSVGHVVTRSVRDSALMLEALAGYEPGAPYGQGLPNRGFFEATRRDPTPLRIAVCLSEPTVAIDPEVRASVLDAAALLEQLGHSVEMAAPGIDYAVLNRVQNTLIASNMAAWLDSVARGRGREIGLDELEPMTHMIRSEGSRYTGAQVAEALQLMHQFGFQMGDFFRDFDAILQPVAATPAPRLAAITYREGDDLQAYTERFKAVSAFTHLYNMTGQPSMAVPFSMSASGLPIGIMLSAPGGEDAQLMALAGQIERARPWFQYRPKVWSGAITTSE